MTVNMNCFSLFFHLNKQKLLSKHGMSMHIIALVSLMQLTSFGVNAIRLFFFNQFHVCLLLFVIFYFILFLCFLCANTCIHNWRTNFALMYISNQSDTHLFMQKLPPSPPPPTPPRHHPTPFFLFFFFTNFWASPFCPIMSSVFTQNTFVFVL